MPVDDPQIGEIWQWAKEGEELIVQVVGVSGDEKRMAVSFTTLAAAKRTYNEPRNPGETYTWQSNLKNLIDSNYHHTPEWESREICPACEINVLALNPGDYICDECRFGIAPD